MKIEIRKRAWNSITKTAAWIDAKNLPGSGDRWADKIYSQIKKIAKNRVEFSICNNIGLKKFNYRCFHIDEWVVAYKKNRDTFTIYRFIHGSRLR